MNRQKMASLLLVFALTGVTGLAGCSSTQSTASSRTPQEHASGPSSWHRAHGGDGQATTTATASTPDRTGWSGWPTMRSDNTTAWSALAYPTGDARSSAIGIEMGVPREVRANSQFESRIVVTNLTDGALTDVVVTEMLGDNYKLSSSSPQGRAGADGAVTWALGTLGPRESKTIRLMGTAADEGTVGTCASVSYASQLCASVPVVMPKLRVTKSGPSDALVCDEIVYTYEVSNTGTGTLNNVRVNDQLPAGLVNAQGGNTVSVNVGTLAAGQSRPYTVRVKADRTGRFESKAIANGEGVEAESGMVATIVRQPVLEITTECTSGRYIGRPMTYEITVTNSGDGVARNTALEDMLPDGADFVSASDGGSLTGRTIAWNLGELAPKASKTVTVRLVPNEAGTYRNTVRARAVCTELVSDSCDLEITGIPAILLEVIDLEDPIPVGEELTYVVVVTNQGSAPARSVRIRCELEDTMQFVSATGATRGTATGVVIEFEPLPSLAPQEKATWRVVVRAVGEGDVRFRTTLNSTMIERPVIETEATHFYR